MSRVIYNSALLDIVAIDSDDPEEKAAQLSTSRRRKAQQVLGVLRRSGFFLGQHGDLEREALIEIGQGASVAATSRKFNIRYGRLRYLRESLQRHEDSTIMKQIWRC